MAVNAYVPLYFSSFLKENESEPSALRYEMEYLCDSFLNKAFVVEGQNQALTKERKFQMLGELTIREVE